MRDLLKNKLFIVLSLVIIFVSILYGNTFASFDIITNDNTTYTVFDKPDDGNKYFILFFHSDYMCMITSSVPIFHGFDVHGNSSTCYRGKDMHLYYSKSGDYSSFLYENTSSFYTYAYDNHEYMWTASSSIYFLENLLYSNHDIVNGSGTVVFQGAPVTVGQVTIPAITQVEEIPQAMNKVLKIMIPIGLIVFSIGLVIYLVRLVISRMT